MPSTMEMDVVRAVKLPGGHAWPLRQDLRVSPISTEQALRAHFRSHNATVLMASGVAAVLSAIGWAVLYGASYWVTMMTVTVRNNGDGGVPQVFNTVFIGSAIVLMLAARLDQWFFPNELMPDQPPPVEHFADMLLIVPQAFIGRMRIP